MASRNNFSELVIIGGGISGLSLAYALRDCDVTVLEAEDDVGGCLRTDRCGPYLVDRTGHLFHFQDPDILELLRSDLGISLNEHVRDAVVKIADREVPYPFQYHIGSLPPEMAYECLRGFYDCSRKKANPSENFASFGKWARDSFGDGIYRHFFRPYNNKLWATDMESMSCEWAKDFVPSPDPEKVLGGAVSAHKGNRFGYNPTFLYPSEGGAGRIPKALAEKLPHGIIKTKARVKEVSTLKRIVRLEDGREINYRHLVVTSPMKTFVQEIAFDVPTSLKEASDRLRAQGRDIPCVCLLPWRLPRQETLVLHPRRGVFLLQGWRLEQLRR